MTVLFVIMAGNWNETFRWNRENINNSINLNSLKYTRGVVSIVKFGSNYPSIHGDMITEIQNIEKKSRDNPIENKLEVGDQVVIKNSH